MYNSTPHTTTGRLPSELFYQRQFRDKVPAVTDIENKITDQKVRDKDKEEKEKGRKYGDRRRRASYSDLEIGRKVYLKNMNRENKLTPNLNPTTHTVTSVKGGDVKVRNDATGKEYRRNCGPCGLKKVEGSWKTVNKNDAATQDNQLGGEPNSPDRSNE